MTNIPSLEIYPDYAKLCVNNKMIFKTKDIKMAKFFFNMLASANSEQWAMLEELVAVAQRYNVVDNLAFAIDFHELGLPDLD